MVHERMIGLASGVLPEFGPESTIDAAARAGFDAVGLWVEVADWTHGTTTSVRRCLADTGLPVIDVEVIWIKPGPSNSAHKHILDIGAEVGARNALVVSSDPDVGATTAKFAELCEHGRRLDIRVALEFGLFTDVKTVDAALSIVKAVTDPAAAVLIDPLHLTRSGGTAADVARVPRHLISYAQFCDAPAEGPDLNDPDAIIREAVDERLQVGEGELPLGDILDALPNGLPLSIELRSKPLRDAYPNPVERAQVTLAATRRFLKAARYSGSRP